jgi:hypothetical protein
VAATLGGEDLAANVGEGDVRRWVRVFDAASDVSGVDPLGLGDDLVRSDLGIELAASRREE